MKFFHVQLNLERKKLIENKRRIKVLSTSYKVNKFDAISCLKNFKFIEKLLTILSDCKTFVDSSKTSQLISTIDGAPTFWYKIFRRIVFPCEAKINLSSEKVFDNFTAFGVDKV